MGAMPQAHHERGRMWVVVRAVGGGYGHAAQSRVLYAQLLPSAYHVPKTRATHVANPAAAAAKYAPKSFSAATKTAKFPPAAKFSKYTPLPRGSPRGSPRGQPSRPCIAYYPQRLIHRLNHLYPGKDSSTVSTTSTQVRTHPPPQPPLPR